MAKIIDQLIINSPYEEPKEHWVYDSQNQSFDRVSGRRRAGYYVTTPGTNQFNDMGTFKELELTNEIRKRVKTWRDNNYPGVTSVTRKLLEHWHTKEVRNYPFFFCQLDAIETIIYLAEAPAADKTGIHIEGDGGAFQRICTKLCTGGGKTTVMAMLIAWQVCNKVSYPQDTRYSKNVFIVAPGITVKDRLQVLQTGGGSNYYIEFRVVPDTFIDKLYQGKVIINNWQALAWDDAESLKKKKSVDKRGPKSDEAYARQVLGSMAKSRNILVINDEAHHAWRKNPEIKGKYVGVDKKDEQEATIWISGLDRIHKARNILTCYDFSATPFAPSGKKNDEEALFSWIVSDFGLNDGIESGLVKTPRIVVKDDNTPDAKTFRSKLYHIYMADEVKSNINQPVKPEAPLPPLIIQAYNLLSADWLETYNEWKNKKSDVPPVMITVANRTETAARIEYAFRHKQIHVDELCDTEFMRHIDSKTLEQAEIDNISLNDITPATDEEAEGTRKLSKKYEAALLRETVNTVGQVGKLGEQIRNVISVGMLTEGWDAKTVTHIMGLRAFSSQLLCEQVVGRGLRRSSYDIGENGLYEPEYVNIFGIPFSFLPHEGDGGSGGQTKTKYYISVVPTKAQYEITWPNITRIDHEIDPRLHVDFSKIPSLTLEASDIRTKAELAKVLDGKPDLTDLTPIDIEEIQKRMRMQNIIFKTSAMVFEQMNDDWKKEGTPYALLSQVFRWVERYLDSNKIVIEPVLFVNKNPEMRKIMYMLNMNIIVQHLWTSIKCQTISRLVPHFNTSNKIRSTGDMPTWWTTKHRETFTKTHTNHIVYDSAMEAAEANKLEKNCHVTAFAKNDHLGFSILYTFNGIVRQYYPDFLIKLANGKTLVLETKGVDSPEVQAKKAALEEWVTAVNSLKEYGQWCSDISYNPADVDGIIGRYVCKT
ncbi:MAG: DEAD/DEAH box helicase family protein [Treponema sp.]|nr:DEAD/DEAH box helicase family protein [Treponema sp.]